MIRKAAILIGVTLLHAQTAHRFLEVSSRKEQTSLNKVVLSVLLAPIMSPLLGLMITLNLELPSMTPRNSERYVERPLFFLNSLAWGWAAMKLLSR